MPYGTPGLLRRFATDNVAGPPSAAENLFGSRTTALGENALRNGGTDPTNPSDDNVAIGFSAGNASQAERSVIIGSGAGDAGLPATTDGIICIGYNAGGSLTLAASGGSGGITFIGYRAGASMVGNGAAAGTSNLLAIGYEAYANATGGSGEPGRNGLYIGNQCGGNLPFGGDNNTFIGHLAAGLNQGVAVSQITNTVLVGYAAGATLISPSTNNVMIGYLAGNFVNGNSNVFVGASAQSAGGAQTVANSVVIGAGAGGHASSFNTFIGTGAGAGLATASDRNVTLGYNAGTSSGLTDDNIVLGYLAATVLARPRTSMGFYVENAGNGLLYGEIDNGNLKIGLGANRNFASGTNVLFLTDSTALPGANPVAGGFLYVNPPNGLTYRGSAGTITVLAAP